MFLNLYANKSKSLIGITSLIILISACSEKQNDTYNRLKSYIDTIKVINTHEHQRNPVIYKDQKMNFYSLLAFSYLRADLVSAGAPRLDPKEINTNDLDKLWETYGPYLDFCRNTSYYSHFLCGFRILYNYYENYFTKEGINLLSQQIADNYSRREEWYADAFERAGFELMFVDQFWNSFNYDLDQKYFALVFNINNLATSVVNKSIQYRTDVPENRSFYGLAKSEGFSIETLDDYLKFSEHLFNKFMDKGTVCAKNSMAYGRSLDYPSVPVERAQDLFAKSSQSLSENEKKELVDFMFHWIIKKCTELNLPIQIHTGYLAGNGNVLENSRPTKLNNLFLQYRKTIFVLFHGGYPWIGEFAALGKMFPNVYLDLVWLPQISREAAVRGLDEMLDTVPYNKFFWGGDCQFIEESTGSLEFGQEVVALVLAKRIERGLLTEEVARDIALKIFRENAIRVFNLQDRIN